MTHETFNGYRAFVNPDNQVMAIFRSDSDQPEPTQHIAAEKYWRENCSSMCYYRDFETKFEMLTWLDQEIGA